MNIFVAKFRDIIKGVITGFDRIVFKGSILPLAHAAGAMSFCQAHGIRNKDFKRWAMDQTALVVDSAQQYARNTATGHSTDFVLEDAQGRPRSQTPTGIGKDSGLIGVWSAVESCWSYRAQYSAQAGHPLLRKE